MPSLNFFDNQHIEMNASIVNMTLFTAATKKLEEKIADIPVRLETGIGEFGEVGLRLNVLVPLERAKRILGHLKAIELDVRQGNPDQLTAKDITNLATISDCTTLFLPDNYHYGFSPFESFSLEQVQAIENYRQSADTINHALGNRYQQLAGEVLQFIGGFVLISLMAASLFFTFSLTIPTIVLFAGLAVSLIGAGYYLNHPNVFSELQIEVNKTVNSPACDVAKRQWPRDNTYLNDPDCSFADSIKGKTFETLYAHF